MIKNLYLNGFSRGFGRVPEASAMKVAKSIEKVRGSVGHALYRLFERILPAEKVLRRAGERSRDYDSPTTLWAMLSQILRGSSLRDAVRELQAVDRLLGRPIRSGNTGSYSEARSRLGDDCVEDAHQRVHDAIEAMTPRNRSGGRLLSVDGTGVQLDDTAANLGPYRYAPGQKPGCGFPVMQQVALMDLGCGAIVEAIATAHTEGESPLFEAGLSHLLEAGDLLLADRAYCSFLNFARILEQGADALMRLNSSRNKQALKNCDDVVVHWPRPDFAASPLHLFRDQWEDLPETIAVRLVRCRIHQPGFRPREILLATTLMNASPEELAALYQRRWEIETEFRHIKTTLGMDHMHVKSPQMAYKQMYLFFIAHNLVRWLMLKAALTHHCPPQRLSFKGAVDCIQRWASEMSHLKPRHFDLLMDELIAVIAADLVPDRPDRIEPRFQKKRPKRFAFLPCKRHLVRNR